jgi:hypothetical protein
MREGYDCPNRPICPICHPARCGLARPGMAGQGKASQAWVQINNVDGGRAGTGFTGLTPVSALERKAPQHPQRWRLSGCTE